MRLMHCPFCGEEEQVRLFCINSGGTNTSYQYCVVCDACACRGPSAKSMFSLTARETAESMWNNRVPVDEDTALRMAFKLT